MKIGIACQWTSTRDQTHHRSVLHADGMLEMLQSVTPGSTQPPGTGAIDDPFRPGSLNNWYWLSTQVSTFLPKYLLIGGRLIARWGTGGGQFVDYCTDVTDFVDVCTARCATNGQSYEAVVRDEIGAWYKTYDSLSGINSRLPSYTRKALRLSLDEIDDRAAAFACRGLIQGLNTCDDCPELACSLASLLVSEAHRAPVTFIVTLMLLDLIETTTTYGRDKHYTWKSMLMYGTSGIEGRGPGFHAHAKHPMVAAHTVTLGGQLSVYTAQNAVRDKIISITSIWLAHYMQKAYPTFTFFILRNDGPQAWNGPIMGPARDFAQAERNLRRNCATAIQARVQSSALLIGGTTVYYQDLAGQAV
jgi:hypothetical protein